MKVLVLGANGMLGHKLCQYLSADFEVLGTVRVSEPALDDLGVKVVTYVDALNISSVERLIVDFEPEVVINSIGVVKRAVGANAPENTLLVNSVFPHLLLQLANGLGIRLITISTDCVFKGQKGNYSEADIPDAVDLYGLSKRFGEVTTGSSLTIRTSIVGRELRNVHGLVEWFLSRRGVSASGYAKAVFSGLTTIEFARVLEMIIRDHPELGGLCHVSGDPINKYELLLKTDRAFQTNTSIEPSEEIVIDRSLDSTRFREETGWSPPSWDEMIDEMAADATPYDRLRGNA